MARTKNGFFLVKTLNNAPAAMLEYPFVGGTVLYEGAVLRISNTSGSAQKIIAGATSILGVLGCNISSASSDQFPVYLANDTNVFEARMRATGAPQKRMHNTYPIAVATTHEFRLQGTIKFGTTGVARVIGVHPDDASGTGANKRYWVLLNNQSLVGAEGGGDPTY